MLTFTEFHIISEHTFELFKKIFINQAVKRQVSDQKELIENIND